MSEYISQYNVREIATFDCIYLSTVTEKNGPKNNIESAGTTTSGTFLQVITRVK
jgi:hypothetical protein